MTTVPSGYRLSMFASPFQPISRVCSPMGTSTVSSYIIVIACTQFDHWYLADQNIFDVG